MTLRPSSSQEGIQSKALIVEPTYIVYIYIQEKKEQGLREGVEEQDGVQTQACCVFLR